MIRSSGRTNPVRWVLSVRACLKQAFVHGRGGQALFCQTYPADVHLSEVVVEVAQALDRAVGQPVVQVLVTDREGVAIGVILTLTRNNKAFVALLKADQYASEADFVRRGRFRHLKGPRRRHVAHRVPAPDCRSPAGRWARAGLIYDRER